MYTHLTVNGQHLITQGHKIIDDNFAQTTQMRFVIQNRQLQREREREIRGETNTNR